MFELIDSGRLKQDLNSALPGKHTKAIYHQLTTNGAAVLCQLQLRTSSSWLNSYLVTIGAKELITCQCDMSSKETMTLPFECPLWEEQRRELRGRENERWKDLIYFLGARTERRTSDGQLLDGEASYWTPNTKAVKRTVRFTLATERLG
jgi:hypothetical protein